MSSSADTEGSWGPTVHGGKKTRRRGRWLGLLLVVSLALPVVYVSALGAVAVASLEEVPVEGLASGSGPLHVLVVGSDSRADLSAEERQALTTGSAEGERTDTILLLSIDGGDVGMLAFPRDLFVTRCDGTEGRINAAIQRGGATCLVRTIRDLSGLPIEHFVSVSFGGFRDIVDAVGGVEVCLDEPISDRDAGIDLPAGCQVLEGANALGYVRVRKIDNDLERIKRQQGFLKALASAVLTPATLANPPRALRTASGIGSALTADQHLGVIALARLGWGLKGLASGAAVTATVPGTPTTIGGAAVLVPGDEAEALFDGFRDGSAFGGNASAEQVDRSERSVTVLNGAGIEGFAGETAEALRERGWVIGEIGNAVSTTETTIFHPPGLRAAADTLANDLPVPAQLVEDASLDDLRLVLGEDLAG